MAKSRLPKRGPENIGIEVTGQTPSDLFRASAKKLKTLSTLKDLQSVKEEDLSVLLSASIDHKASLITNWEAEKKLTKPEMDTLRNTVDLLRVTGSNTDMVAALSKEGINNTRDLVRHSKDSVISIMDKAKVTAPESTDMTSFAEEILSKAEAENPSAFFLHRIVEKPEWLELDPSSRPTPTDAFKEFYKKNENFDLKNEPIISLQTGKLNEKIVGIEKPTAALIKELSFAQQSLQLTSDSDVAALLFSKKVNISKAVTTTHQTLMRELGIDASAAIEIKQKAQHYHEAALNGFLAYKDIITNPFLKQPLENFTPVTAEILEGVGATANWSEVAEINGLKDVNNIEDFFGPQNYCECDSCKSVLSPAAYFVDLMRFTEKRVLVHGADPTTVKTLEETQPIHLKVRRPDLWKLELTCDNTNNRIPYVEIINEVLTAFVEKHAPINKPTPQRLIEEKPGIEFLLPYNQYLDEVRVWLSYFKLTRLEVLEYLYPTPNTNENLILSIERLNLSSEQYDIIINQNLQARVENDVLAFRKKSGLSAEDTEQLTKLKFWENKLAIVQKKDTSDIQKFNIEFSSSLANWQGTLHRLIRLWRFSGWSLRDLDLIFQAFDIRHNSLNNGAILSLASFKQIHSLLKADISVIVGILKGLPDSSEDGLSISWSRILPKDWKLNHASDLEELSSTSTDEAFNLLLKLQGIFGVNSNDLLDSLDLLKDSIGNPSGNGAISLVFNTNTLNTIYRYIQLYKWTGASSFAEFVKLLEIWGKGTVKLFTNPSADIPAFVRFIQSFGQNKITIEDLIYLFDKEIENNTPNAEDKQSLSGKEIKELIASDTFKNGDKFALLFNKWTAIDTVVVSYYKLFLEATDTALGAMIADLETATPTDETFTKLTNIRQRLERLEYLMAKYKIDVDTLKLLATEAKDSDYPKLGFTAWQDKEWVKALAYLGNWIVETKDLRNFNLWHTLKDIENETTLPQGTQKAIAKWKKIELTEVSNIITKTSSILDIQSVWDRVDWAKKLNVNTDVLNRLKSNNTVSDLQVHSQMLLNAIRSKFDDNQTWETQIQDYRNKLSSNKRDALCNFVMFNKDLRTKGFEFDDREDLYQYFLLDVGMGDCFTLPRIVAATNSLQVYIHRCMMGFEQSKDQTVSVVLDMDEKQEWEWRKNYRVWEANRKIFLFPENYIEPEIRDNKSPEFRELEDELLQQKLNMEVVENAYKKYLQQIMTLAELKIAGAYHDKEYNRIYLFGKTNRQPVEYYYRDVEFLESGGVLWSSWEKINIAIPSEDVSAIRYNEKLYIFWTTFARKDISQVVQGTQEIKMHTYDVFANYTYLQVDKKWSAPQRIELNYRKSSPFDPFLRLEKYKGLVEPNNTLKAEAYEIRENVLKEFERTVYRKPYPVKVPADRNLLYLDYIWTDQKNALQPVYRYTRAIIDAFTVRIKIRVKVLTIQVEQNLEFSFNRFDQIVLWAGSTPQADPPQTISINERKFTFTLGGDKFEFFCSFSSNGTKYSIRTGSTTGNKMFFFKSPNTEIKSGNVELVHRTDYVQVSKLVYERSSIKLADQQKYLPSPLPALNTTSLTREYDTYYDTFHDFFVTDGTNTYADGVNDCKIQQRDMVAILTTPSNQDANKGYNLNPEQIQMLWDKVSISIDDLLDHNTQRHVAYQIDYSKSFGNYFFEVFFHIPMRIADHLNAAGKYREANHWYSYIYNPTAIKDKFEQLAFPHDVNWRFAAFRNMAIKKLQEIYSDPNAIELYQRNPGNPHAIARLRVGAYQKNVVMKYLDNLMDWADYLFEQFTPESTSEARHLYSIVKSILGDKPEKTGKCKETKTLTYAEIDINENSDFIYNFFSTVPVESSNNAYHYEKKYLVSGSDYQKIEHTSNAAKTNIKASSAKKASLMAKKAGKAKKVKEISKSKYNGTLNADKQEAMPETPVVYFNTEVDLIFCFPHNKDFIQYWDRVNDRIHKLNNCLDINGVKKQMPSYAPEIDPALLARMVAGGMSFDEIAAAINGQLPNYRFSHLIEKAKQFCGTVQSFGGALFAAIEKRDGEELTLLRTRHEQNILTLTTRNKKRQIDQAKASHANLLESQTNIEKRRAHYASLVEEGLIEWEDVEQVAKWTSGSIRVAEGLLQLLSGAFRLIPQLGSPFAMKYGGLELGDSANRFANALEATAKISDNVAMLAGLEASHQRREQEWMFQRDTAAQELKGVAEQIKASEISVAIAESDLALHDANIEQYKELYEFYTNKFSNYQHYTFQVQQLQKLYRMAFNTANDIAMQAQRAFEFERYGTQYTTDFIKPDNWNNEKSGLFAGDRLMLQLLQLEKEFLDTHKRTIEITQHFSMLQISPDKLYELKTSGECADFLIPEAAFDLTYPGYFRRIIKSVRLTIPCIAGPYTNIGATLTLGNNKIRKDTDSSLTDFTFNGCAMIATSNAQSDGGQFELNFRDERYLPFEGAGAISSWTLSLPNVKVRPAFDYNTIADVIFHVSYTADFDGTFKTTVESNLIAELNKIHGTGLLRAFSLRHDFPNEWNILSAAANSSDVVLDLKREHFPYFTNISEISKIESKCFTVGAANNLELRTSNEGISKDDKMKVRIPKEVGKKEYKDVIFFVKYLVK